MPNTAVIYARYSSAQQRDASIEQQVKVCQKYAADNGLTVLRVYDDHAMTGTNDNRPMFQQMIRDSASGAFSFVIVYSLDRFSRDRYDSAIHKHTLKERGVKVLSAVENIQDNPTGVLMESILEGFAEYYSKELAQKVRRGIRSNAEKAMVVAQLPLGYRRGADGKFEIVPEEAEVVREIFRRVADGDQLSEIYTDLNARGIRTKKGHAFGKNSFQGLLHNEKYIGIFRYDDIVLTDAVPPIVDEATFRRVQERYSGASHQYHPKKRVNQNGSYLLTGKLFCGHCKGPMVGTSGTGKHGELHYYYTCRTRQKTKTCKKKPVRRDEIERLIAQRLHQMIFAEDVVDRIADELIAYLKANEMTDEVRNLTAQIQALEREEANTLKAIRMGVVAAPVQKMLEQIETDLDALRARLLLAKERARSDITKDEVLTLFEMFREGDIGSKEYQEKLIDAFLIRAYVYDDRVKIIFNYSAAGSNEIEIPFDIDTVEKPVKGSDKAPEGVSIDVLLKSDTFFVFIRNNSLYLYVCLTVINYRDILFNVSERRCFTMKRCFIALLLVLCMLLSTLPAIAASYEDDLPSYEVNAPANQRGRLYMYQSASSSGNPIATYYNGTVLKMLQLAVNDTYSYVIGPDQKSGYVRTAWLREVLYYSYDDEALEAYRIIANRRSIYMFPVPSDSGSANAAYSQGTILKMIDYDADKIYALVIGPDGAYGYMRKEYLMKVYDYSDESYAPYRVTSTYSTGYLYMYAKPNSNGTPLATYYNDTLLRVIDYEVSRDFCLAVGPDGQAGYVRKELISLEGEDGSLGPVFEVFSSRLYVYMYAKPNSGSTNLGRCDNGEEIEIINWGADSAYAFVRSVKNSKYGYIEKKSLIPSSLSPVKGYMVIRSQSRAYVYLYEKANSGSKNLGRYDNGQQVGILDWNASEDYALVYTADEKIGFKQKASLASLF